MKILGVKPRNKGSMVLLELGLKAEQSEPDKLEVWCSADMATVQSWRGEVPDTYELKTKRDSTEQILVEKRSQGQTSYRNTKEAFEAEARSRLAWQQIEEERKDRRTALMTACEALRPGFERAVASGKPIDGSEALRAAEGFYRWLRETSGGGELSPKVGSAKGTGAAPPPGSSSGAGVPRGNAGDSRPQAEPSPDTTPPSVSGKGAGGTTPEGGTEGSTVMVGRSDAPPSGHIPWPVDPLKCDHKLASGRFASVTDHTGGTPVIRCAKCGTPKVTALEGTTADLGS